MNSHDDNAQPDTLHEEQRGTCARYCCHFGFLTSRMHVCGRQGVRSMYCILQRVFRHSFLGIFYGYQALFAVVPVFLDAIAAATSSGAFAGRMPL